MLARTLFAIGVVCAASSFAAEAQARAAHESPYSYRQTFGSALRLIKVDLAFKVVETNSKWGFFIFEYTSPSSGKRKNRGTVQLVKQSNKVQVAIDLPQMPMHHEQLIIDKLKRKLAREHGAPPKPPKPPKKKKPAGDDKKPAKDGEKQPAIKIRR